MKRIVKVGIICALIGACVAGIIFLSRLLLNRRLLAKMHMNTSEVFDPEYSDRTEE